MKKTQQRHNKGDTKNGWVQFKNRIGRESLTKTFKLKLKGHGGICHANMAWEQHYMGKEQQVQRP